MTASPSRRQLLAQMLAGGAAAAGAWGLGGCSTLTPPEHDPRMDPRRAADRFRPWQHAAPGAPVDAFLDELAERSFRYFWDTANPANGLIPDRWPTPSFASIAAVGFGLSSYPIAAERGWITRRQAAERTRTTLQFLKDAPQGDKPRGMTGHRGHYYHFVDLQTGARFGQTEVSTIDTALLIAGALHAGQWFDANDPIEQQIRLLAEELYARVDWAWTQPRPHGISHGWTPEGGRIPYDYLGYNEAMLLYLLAIGSPVPQHRADPKAWDAWCAPYERLWGSFHGQTFLQYPTLFVHQFTHAWIDFRGMPDAYMRGKGIDYEENSRRATLAQRQFAIDNPDGWAGYGENEWGITACDGPVDATRIALGKTRRFISYGGRGTGRYDDGTIAPYAAGSSMPFTPRESAAALTYMRDAHGRHILGEYGFFAFNRSYDFTDQPLQHGRVQPGFGWVDTDFLGIEVGPLLMMLANARDGSVWKAMRGQPDLQRALRLAGFRGGWVG